MEVEIAKREGSRVSKADFEVIRKAVVDLSARPEGVRPEDLLEEARSAKSPLHKFFEWDNDVAAEKYRIEQARKLIYTVTIRIIEDGHEPMRTNYAVRVVDIARGSVYRPIQDVMDNPAQRAQIVQRALLELQMWESRYESIVEFASIFAATKEARNKVKNLLRKSTTVRKRK